MALKSRPPQGYEIVSFNTPQVVERRLSELNVMSLEQVDWYHGELTRASSETILMANGLEGSYLLRKSKRHDGFSVSVKCQGAVKHFVLKYNNKIHQYEFGNAVFNALKELLDHFESCPILTKDDDLPVTLLYPYSVEDDEPSVYEKPDGQALCGKGTFDTKPKIDKSVASKSGYLFKRGNIRKNWKERWFAIEKKSLKYFDNRLTDNPIRDLDISEVTQVDEFSIDEKKNCFRLVFPHRTFYFHAKSPVEAKEWIDFFQWKINYYKKLDS